jgi:hypothetical protein
MAAVTQLEPGKHGETVHNGKRLIRGPHGVTILDGESSGINAGPSARGHNANLANRMDRSERRMLADRLLEYLEVDRASRADWEQREAIGVALMGVNELPEDIAEERDADVNSPGVAQVKMPLMIEASVRFQSHAIP